jgi:DNA-binding CsgD family transcriptional regulator
MLRSLIRSATRRSFLNIFGIILIAELFTVFFAWSLLGVTTNQWIKAKAMLALRITQEAASSGDWSLVDKIPKDRDTAVGIRYGKMLSKLDDKYFPHKEGAVYLVSLENGEEYDVGGDDTQMSDTAEANQWETTAYAKGVTVYSPIPIVDDYGTYVAGYVPINRNGKVRGLIAAEFDTAPLGDFQSVVRKTFLLSIIPVLLLSLIVAAILAAKYAEPTEVFREVDETATSQLARSHVEEEGDPWNLLTPQEKGMAEQLRLGRESAKEIGDALSLTPGTVYTYFKRIKAKTGWSKQALAVQAAARREASGR